MSFTRKRIGHRKYNPDGILEIDLHRLLNRIDVEKDAIKPTVSIYEGYESFTKCADILFGEMPYRTYDQSSIYIANAIHKYATYKNEAMRIGQLHTLSTPGILPSYIRYVIQDAGVAPKQYLSYLQYVVTPGSYLDPASRPRGDILSEFGSLNKDDFASLGLTMLQSLKSEIHSDNSCTIKLQLQNDNISVLFNPNFTVNSGDIQYFAGNICKNQWFNASRLYSQKEEIRYILCKELGDTLQAYYGAKFIKHTNTNPKEVCLFTNDANLFLRCQLLNLQSIHIILRGESGNLLYHYPVMSEVTSTFIDMYNSNLQAHNANVVKSINRVLHKNRFYRCNGKIVRFSNRSSVARILTQCIVEIQQRTEQFKSLLPSRVTPEEYRKLSQLYMANELFTLDVINHGMKTLFIEHSPGSRMFDPSFGNALSGGGVDAEVTIEQGELPEYEMRYNDFKVITTLDEQTDPTLLLLNVIYKYYNTCKAEWSDNQKLFATELFYNSIYMLFSYYCLAIWNETIIKELIELYDSDFLGSLTYTEFKPIIDKLKEKYLPPLDVTEKAFQELYMPKEDESRMLEILASLASSEPTIVSKFPTQTRKHPVRVTARRTRRKQRQQ